MAHIATPSTSRTRRAARRAARASLRMRARDYRATARAIRAVATGAPQPAKTHLIAAGLTPADAKRFAGAFSNRVAPTAVDTARIKLKGRVRKTVKVKLYNTAAFTARLLVYRPKDATAAARFERVALAVAA